MTNGDGSTSRTRAIVVIVAVGLLLLLISCTTWVGVRTLMAKAELEAAVPIAARAQDEIFDGDTTAARRSISELARHASSAAELTSDPIFAASQSIPFLGANLVAVRQIATSIDAVASSGLMPLAELAASIGPAMLQPVDGKVALQPLIDAAPTLSDAEQILATANADVGSIDTAATIDPITDAVDRLSRVLDEATGIISAASRAAQLLPAMLGASEERNYLLMFQNNAELRASGGLPGALAIITTSDGSFEMTAQASANAFPKYPQSLLPIDSATQSLHGNIGQYMQNVNLTPDFPTSARLAAAMWNDQFELDVDGVIAVDPVLLGYILAASGPVELSTGDVIDSSNAVDFLLSEVYAKYPEPSAQDPVFAEAARAVFGTLSSGSLDSAALMSALRAGSEERRILIWNSRSDEQDLLAGTVFAGTLPDSNLGSSVVGVYFNDAGGAKMGYYFDARTTVTSDSCASGPGSYLVDVALSSSAPMDAASSLPRYVTADGFFGVPAGTIRTKVIVYAPVGSLVVGTRVDGSDVRAQVEEHLGRRAAQFLIDLKPGESKTVSVELTGPDDTAGPVAVQATPLIRTQAPEIKDRPCE